MEQSSTPLTQNALAEDAPFDLKRYEQVGGYRAARKALTEMTPEQVREEVKAARLRGRGGAGFPAGVKWGFVPQGEEAPHPKYLVVNADEMEPGTFKDRLLLERDPHQMIEAMIISAWAMQADVGYIFLRWAYHVAYKQLITAIQECREAGWLGENILGTGWSFDVHIHVSAGRYMCGEETGLLNALEGKRATPRAKPPFPPVSGVWGKPTIVNNVETLYNVPHIVNHGADWFLSLSAEGTGDGGTKIYGASGKVKNPGLWELPLGTPVREVLEKHAGGMRDGLGFKALLPGGASTGFVVEEDLDLPMDFDGMDKAGSRLGTGTMIVLDDQTCPVGMVQNLEAFFGQESCGWCTPCREGLPWTAKVLASLCNGEGDDGDIEQVEHHAKFLGPGFTFCALAPGAAAPLESALRHFREEFERHIREGGCPWRRGATTSTPAHAGAA